MLEFVIEHCRVARFFFLQQTETGKKYIQIENGQKYTKWPKICRHLPLQNLPKFTQIGIFGFENMPSDNPEYES
jgi:hypothetical protein